MNDKYLEEAAKKFTDTRILINGASKRAAQLARGARPLVQLAPGHDLEFLDIALLEIIQDKLRITCLPPGKSASSNE